MSFCFDCGSELNPVEMDGIRRLACPDCGFVHWENPVPVVTALVEHNGKFILARNRAWPEGMYSLISGYLEKKELPEEAVLREVSEELGLTGTIASFIGHYTFQHYNQLLLAYHVIGRGTLSLGVELSDVKLIEKSDLKPWDFGTGEAVKDWLDGYVYQRLGEAQ